MGLAVRCATARSEGIRQYDAVSFKSRRISCSLFLFTTSYSIIHNENNTSFNPKNHEIQVKYIPQSYISYGSLRIGSSLLLEPSPLNKAVALTVE